MKKIKIFLLSVASSFSALAADIDVTPGKLESLLPDGGKGQTELKLKGSIDARDLAALESLSSDVKSLDLSQVKIESLTMPNRQLFGRTLFQEGEIPAYTFFKAAVSSLILPADITAIGEGAFAGSDITQISIPEGVTALGDYAFYGCPNLVSVSLPSSLKSIGKGAFGNCPSLVSLNLSNTGITSVPERAFAGSVALESVSLPAGIISVGREAFSHTAIGSLDLSNVSEFQPYALSSMPFLTELAINPSAVINDGLLMDDTSLASLTGVPELVPDYFAANCGSLDASALGQSEEIGSYSFANTLAPESLVLPSALTSIGRGALSGLNGITEIDATALEDNLPIVDDFSFEGLNQAEIVLWVTDASYDLWKDHPVWGLFLVQSQENTGIDSVTPEDASGIKVALRSGMIVIESSAPVTDVRIYTADGRMAFVASPDREHVDIETALLPSGIVIVAVSDADGNSKTLSLLLP